MYRECFGQVNALTPSDFADPVPTVVTKVEGRLRSPRARHPTPLLLVLVEVGVLEVLNDGTTVTGRR